MIESGFFTSLIGFFIVLTPLIFFHELGHFLIARFNKVDVESLRSCLMAHIGTSTTDEHLIISFTK